ncbi:MAG: hypothetical protein ACK5AZ_11405 [Bryobacteraceae bacterium]
MNGASGRGGGFVAPGEIVTLLGSRLGPDETVTAELSEAGRLPATLAGRRVRMGSVYAPLLSVQASEIRAVVPFSAAPGGELEISVESDVAVSEAAKVEVGPTRFALFTADGTGDGYAAALNEDGSVNRPENRSARGSVVMLFGTGAGAMTPPLADGAIVPIGTPESLPKPASPVTATVGGLPAEVLYAGPAPGLLSGVTQIKLLIPESEELLRSPAAVIVTIGGSSSWPAPVIGVR